MRIVFPMLVLAMMSACNEVDPPPVDVSGAMENVDIVSNGTSRNNEMLSEEGSGAHVLARIGDSVITQGSIDKEIEIQLYELEWAAYELRRQALAEAVLTAQNEAKDGLNVDVLIQPPIPPRVQLPTTNRPFIGEVNAPVTLSIFCNYQSSHCLRMQAVYEELTKLYPSRLKFEFYELPLAFHRNAFGASIASYCANKFGNFDGFHKALWSASDALEKETYMLTAGQLGMDVDDYEACINANEGSELVKANMQLANELGFKNVPVTLVNGLYINGPKDVNLFRFMIDAELKRLGESVQLMVASDQATLKETKLNLRLEGVLLGEDDSQGSAIIQTLSEDATKNYQRGQSVMPGVVLRAIHKGYVVLGNGGVLERLSLSANALERDRLVAQRSPELVDDALMEIERAAVASGNVLDTDEPPPAGLEYQYRGVVAPAGEKPLTRSWLDQQLQKKDELQAHFKPTELEVEGVRMMRLEDVTENEFYKVLGLQENDVVMRVNGEWVHEQNNTLLSSLETGEELSVILMRKGFPVHYAYKVN